MSNSEILCSLFNLYVLIVGALLAALCLFISLLVAVCLCGFAETREVIGTFGEKSVRAFRKKIPQQAEGYYLKITPTEIVVAGRDESGTFYGEQTLKTLSDTPLKGEKLSLIKE